MNDDIQLWGSGRRAAPPRPEYPEIYPETDSRHWYDLEYSGWNAGKENLPESPGDGPSGKHVICIHHLLGHPYMMEYDRSMAWEAERFGLSLETWYSEWDPEFESDLVDRAIRAKPDMIILTPESPSGGTELFRRINRAGIPLIASNLIPEPEGFRYILAWTGPDDWGQFRMLSRTFARLMGGEGEYCIVGHIPGTSAFYARKWAVITELASVAPHMEFLDAQTTGLRTDTTRETVLAWLDRYGGRLKGIISADDSLAQLGINKALAERGRDDVIRVACGATPMGMRFLKEGSLSAITFQPPELDGALPVHVAVDWFNGLTVEPMRYLPLYLVDASNIEDFLIMRKENPDIDLDPLAHMVAECDIHGVGRFFDEILARFKHEKILSEEYFRGFAIEVLSRLMSIARSEELSTHSFCGDYESLFKQLFQRRTPRDTIEWLRGVAQKLMTFMEMGHRGCLSLGDKLRLYVDEHYRDPLSLKLLSARFGISAAYLGKVFKESSGVSFASYLNERRIRAAERILASRRVKAKDVAMAVGYSEPNYFYSMFKKITGHYPSEISPDDTASGDRPAGSSAKP
ncbi:MAG: substrate-binding domain-containing protein [Rectinemataceae bacterium]